MILIKSYLESWRRFRDLKGRTTRPAFWWAFILNPFVFIVLGGIFALIFGIESDEWGPEIFYGIAYIWVLITLLIRRRNDMGRKGNVLLLWWLAAPSASETSE
jgi:uncharacterized membrane protein YhaH (DUF805 family)